MKPFVLGIAGGSGSGKSSLSFNLQDSMPGLVLVFHLDDYFRPEAEVPVRAGMKNWDSPQAQNYALMAKDLASLKAGNAVTINTKSPRLNPGYAKTFKRIPVLFEPKPLIVVEGFLALHYPKVRKLLDLSVFLEAGFDVHTGRRVHGSLHNFPADYNRRVLAPMHQRYVEPSRVHADIVLDAGRLSEKEVLAKVQTLVMPRLTTI